MCLHKEYNDYKDGSLFNSSRSDMEPPRTPQEKLEEAKEGVKDALKIYEACKTASKRKAYNKDYAKKSQDLVNVAEQCLNGAKLLFLKICREEFGMPSVVCDQSLETFLSEIKE